MPIIVEKEHWEEWLRDPEEQDRKWTYYQCPCGHEVMSDISFPHLNCLKCNSRMKKIECG